MPVEWFCNVCRIHRDPFHLSVHRGGAFSQMMDRLEARNSSAFRLPGPVRNHFEGVRTGPDGEYEEVTAAVKPPARYVLPHFISVVVIAASSQPADMLLQEKEERRRSGA